MGGLCPCFVEETQNGEPSPAVSSPRLRRKKKPSRRKYGKIARESKAAAELESDRNAARAPAAGGIELEPLKRSSDGDARSSSTASSAAQSEEESSPSRSLVKKKHRPIEQKAALEKSVDAMRQASKSAKAVTTASIGMVASSAAYASRATTHAKHVLEIAHKGDDRIRLRILGATAKSGAAIALDDAQLAPTILVAGEGFSSGLWVATASGGIATLQVAIESVRAWEMDGGQRAAPERRSAETWCWRSVWNISFAVKRKRGRKKKTTSGSGGKAAAVVHAMLKWKGSATETPDAVKSLLRQKGSLGHFGNGIAVADNIALEPKLISCHYIESIDSGGG